MDELDVTKIFAPLQLSRLSANKFGRKKGKI